MNFESLDKQMNIQMLPFSMDELIIKKQKAMIGFVITFYRANTKTASGFD